MTIIVAGWICSAQKRSARRKLARGEGVSLRFGNCVAGWLKCGERNPLAQGIASRVDKRVVGGLWKYSFFAKNTWCPLWWARCVAKNTALPIVCLFLDVQVVTSWRAEHAKTEGQSGYIGVVVGVCGWTLHDFLTTF